MIVIVIIIAIDRIQRRRLIEKANRDTKEKELLQAKEIEKAYKKLKATQSQLLVADPELPGTMMGLGTHGSPLPARELGR